jgi:hypothetical protein
MAYTALQLITRAFYLSAIVSRPAQTVSGDQITDGLYLLNSCLDFKSSDLRLIPYYQLHNFSAVVGQEKYYIEGLLSVETLTFNIGSVRYSLSEKTRDEYFAYPRVDNIQSLPFSYRIERSLGGSDIYIYFKPDQAYPMHLMGKFGLTDVALNTDLSAVYDAFYIEYLRYALAEMICSEYGATFPDESKAKLKEYEKKIMDVSPSDLSIQKKTYFGGNFGIDWKAVNLYRGYTP